MIDLKEKIQNGGKIIIFDTSIKKKGSNEIF